VHIYIYLRQVYLSKKNGKTRGTTFAENTRKFQTELQVVKLLTIPPLSAWKYYKQLLFLVDMFSSRKLQISIPSVPSQASEPADDSNQEDEYGMAEDSIIDADPEVSNASGDTQEAEVVGAAQKDQPAGPSMNPLRNLIYK